MKKVQRSAKQDTALDELYKRYEDRGNNYNKSPEYAEQESRALLTRSSAPKSYRVVGGTDLKKYKSGVSVSGRYMTEGDFATYYRANRDYTPDSSTSLDEAVVLDGIDRERYKNKNKINNNKMDRKDVKAQLIAEAQRANPKALGSRVENKAAKHKAEHKKASKVKEAARVAAKTWIPLDERNTEKCVEGKKTKMPTGAILAILVIAFSLLLIVASSMLLSSARLEQSEIKESIGELETEVDKLQDDLDKKNEDADIEIFAKEELGMIGQEHVNAEYIDSNKADGVQKHENDEFSFASLIKWFFGFLR